LQPLGIVFLDQAETPPDMISENREAVERYSGIRVAGVIGRIDDFTCPPRDYFRPLAYLFPDEKLTG
jgi:dethiobiotin synthetase